MVEADERCYESTKQSLELIMWAKKRNIISILLVGVPILLVMLLFVLDPRVQFRDLGCFIFNFQTLIGALIALITAVVGIWALYHIEAEKWQSKRAAARAVLPLSLSGISEYTIKCAPLLMSLYGKCVDGALPKPVPIPDFPPLPLEAISSLKEMVEFSYSDERQFVSKLLARIQIQSTRITGMAREHLRPDHIVLAANLDAYLIDAASIYARSASIYAFARGDSDRMPKEVSNQQIASALHNMRIFDETYDRLARILGVSDN